eukprot:CAMPEP_0194214914 /NCGR_PEP_ID=MMETSP0156-20130528/16341_1 /TAXON_ID=33649 /ORGANISM="Thalassionema nitzschioides, Strain L26-B" /LENGTH=599 /DNA_ID=CAMNT_0038943289 /DNA_START=280 /DNA_END=2075 /DNA_ORIENTATION=+
MNRYQHSLSLLLIATLLSLHASSAQHYCWPCALSGGVIGKDTHAASNPDVCYEWMFKYLNNVVPGSDNRGNGVYSVTGDDGDKYSFSLSEPPNIIAAEGNEPGITSFGNATYLLPEPPAEKKGALENAGLRLPTGPHKTPCARTGRAAIINATLLTGEDLTNFSKFTNDWGEEYVQKMSDEKNLVQGSFGIHNVACMYHPSGPCKLADIELAIASAWANNYTNGYVPLMDNNVMLWTTTLGPLLDAYVRDGVEFYPMRWSTNRGDGMAYSVLANPCGLTMVEIASTDVGSRGIEQFNSMPHRRAILEQSSIGNDETLLPPLVPIRISRAVGADLMDATLEFYGAGEDTASLERAAKLGFNTTILADETIDGDRAVTIMLSDDATVHLQLWARQEEEVSTDSPEFPSDDAFVEAKGSNQVNGGQPQNAKDFCKSGTWTVGRFNTFVKKTLETTLSPPPSLGYDVLKPPVGSGMNMFMDTHFSWDCTAPHCEIAAGTQALFESGSRLQMFVSSTHSDKTWMVYSHDPSGFGMQLHWIGSSLPGFDPQGVLVNFCLKADEDGACAGSFNNSKTYSDNETTSSGYGLTNCVVTCVQPLAFLFA